jgi:thiol-disulfide isomerase/thioredoxin
MIRFDPRKLPPASRPASISFAHASHTQTELAALDRELAAPPTALAARREALERALAAEHDPIIRGALLVTFFAVPDQLDLSSSEIRELTARLIAAVPADSDLWELWPQALSRATAVSPDPAARDYAERGAHALSDRSRAASVIFTLAYNAKLNGRNADITRLYRDLVANYAGTMESRNARIFDPDRKIRVGQPVPAFDLPSLDDPHKRITREGLPGKFVLFDFWATWCHPCMEEMPRLHAAYKAFRSRGLSIISIDANEPNEVVKAFRKAKWPMPWQHAVNADDVATKTFDVAVFPTAILVDPTGTIVAVDEDLLGDRLAKTLERVLGHT